MGRTSINPLYIPPEKLYEDETMSTNNSNPDEFVIELDEILSKEEFIKLVDSYPSIEDAIRDGVGIDHSFPPEGEVSAEWNMMIWTHS